jgi:hypothetical protein
MIQGDYPEITTDAGSPTQITGIPNRGALGGTFTSPTTGQRPTKLSMPKSEP